MKATETQKEIAKYLYELVNNTFGGVAVPLRLASFIQGSGAAIGLCVRFGLYNEANNTIGLYLA